MKRLGVLLLTAGVVLAVLGAVWWAHESHRVDRANLQHGFEAAVAADNGSPFSPAVAHPQRGGQIILFVIAGASGLFGMMLIAGREGAADPKADGS